MNGEQALVVHENEVLFQHEYQQKMMMLAHYADAKGENTQLVDEQFYLQHAYNYQYDPAYYQQQMAQRATASQAPKAAAPNLLQKQLLFLRKKTEKKEDDKEGSPPQAVAKPVIPVDRPNKPNKEKQKTERYIPEPARRPYNKWVLRQIAEILNSYSSRSYRRDDYRDNRDYQKRDYRDTRPAAPREERRRSREVRRERSRRSRSRSLTWSPIDNRR